MKRLLILSALALIVGAASLRLLQHDPGYVLIVVAGKAIEMRFWFAVVSVLLTGAVLWWGVRLLLRSTRWLGEGWSLFAAKREGVADRRIRRGLLQFIVGDWPDAQRNLTRAASFAAQPIVPYLAAARSAAALGDGEQAQALLHKAEAVAAGDELFVKLSQARLELAQEQFDRCLTTLQRAQTLAPKNPVVLDLLHQVYLAQKDWPALASLLPELKKQSVLRPMALSLLQQQTYGALLTDAAKGATVSERIQAVHGVWQRLPKDLHQSASMVAIYSRALLRLEQHDQVDALLRVALKQEWNDELIALYGVTKTSQRQQQLQWAEHWLKERPQDPTLRLSLGRICLRNELWGQARDYFLAAIKLKPQPVAYAELARLMAALGEHKLSADYYQQGLLLTVNDLPKLPLPRR